MLCFLFLFDRFFVFDRVDAKRSQPQMANYVGIVSQCFGTTQLTGCVPTRQTTASFVQSRANKHHHLLPFLMANELRRTMSWIHDDDAHEVEGELPSETRQRLGREFSNFTASNVSASTRPAKSGSWSKPAGIQRKASTMTAFFANTSVADNFHEEGLRPTMIQTLLFFKEPLDVAEVWEALKERLAIFPRFCSILQKDSSNPLALGSVSLLEQGPETMDMEYHVEEGKGMKSMQGVNKIMDQHYETPLDTSKPLWKFYVINDMEDGHSLLLGVIDHSIADGMTLVQCLLAILDDPVDKGVTVKRRATKAPGMSPPLDVRMKVFLLGICKCIVALLAPKLLADADTAVRLKSMTNTSSKCVWATPPIETAKVKKVAAAFNGATVNDVLCAVMALCMKKKLVDIGDPIIHSGKSISGCFPVSTKDYTAKVCCVYLPVCTHVFKHVGTWLHACLHT